MRKSSIERLPKPVKDRLQKHLRDNRLTLDEIIADMRAAFPAEETPSRSAVYRYRVSFEDAVAHQREIEEMSQLWVRELKDAPQGKTGRLVAELLRTAAAKAVMDINGEEGGVDVKKLGVLARAFMAIEAGSKRESENRALIRDEVRKELLEEQTQKLDGLEKTGRYPPDVLKRIRQEVYGLE